MFLDRAKVYVEGGRGGDGCVSFRREAHVPKGGPDGGGGGRGGSVLFCADESLRDLAAFRHRRHFKAERGRHGSGADRHGADGEDLRVSVPCGTVIEDRGRGLTFDLVESGQTATVAEGGAGGAGNRRFATATRRAPRFAQKGLPGTSGWLELQLKLLADVGLVGLPNAGKSSLIARISRARPKVADYPFTTLEPVLGTIELEDRQLVVADLPGLIEGASAGAGLGHGRLCQGKLLRRARPGRALPQTGAPLALGKGDGRAALAAAAALSRAFAASLAKMSPSLANVMRLPFGDQLGPVSTAASFVSRPRILRTGGFAPAWQVVRRGGSVEPHACRHALRLGSRRA